MSKQQHLSDAAGHWHPHLMFFQAHTALSAWGANLHGSPVMATESGADEPTTFVVPVGQVVRRHIGDHGAPLGPRSIWRSRTARTGARRAFRLSLRNVPRAFAARRPSLPGGCGRSPRPAAESESA